MRDERAQVAVLAILVISIVVLSLAVVVLDVGNWFVHARQLQTKADAAAFAGGDVWGFPCGTNIDTGIDKQARDYFGPHTEADGTAYTTTSFNRQVGGVGPDQIHVVLNGSGYWTDSSSPGDRTSPTGSICESKTLDVKATEDNAPPILGLLPFFPDIKRKARVEIQEVAGLTGLLPIAVRVPKPLSAAAVFYDEATGTILSAKYLCESSVVGLPAGLGGWTTYDPANPSGLCPSWANFDVAASTGVVIATSFRPACSTPGASAPCLSTTGFTTVNDFCRQASGTVQCQYATGTGTTQTVQSGLQFIRGYDNAPNADDDPPLVRSVWLDSPSANCGAYFNAITTGSCTAALHVSVDIGSVVQGTPPTETRTTQNTEVRYRQVTAAGNDVCGNGTYQPACDLSPSWSTTVRFDPFTHANAFAIRVRLKNTTVPGFPSCGDSTYSANCQWFFTANGRSTNVPTVAQILAAPVQRSFAGDIDTSGPVKWLRVTTDSAPCNGIADFFDAEAASQPSGAPGPCFWVDVGFQGGIAKDQDEPPIALNLGDNSSERAYIDCDPNIANVKSEIVSGCQWPSYSTNKFDTTPLCPGVSGFFNVPKPAPFANWPPFRCVLTQTGNASQLIQGFNERIFGTPNSPSCPADNPTQPVKGRNYWHRDNNAYDNTTFAWDGNTPTDTSDDWGNRLAAGDPRLVTLFFTTYDSFTSPGNDVFPIVAFGNFYITGYGRVVNGRWQGGAPDDPCTTGNDGDPYNGNGNEPPPDLDYSRNTTWVWGHFVKDVTPAPFTTGGSGILCNPVASFQPCVAVLVR